MARASKPVQRRRRGQPSLFLPELVEPNPGPWEVQEVMVQDAAVDTKHRKAWVPKAHTPTQRLARFHELGHVKYSPRDWDQHLSRALTQAKLATGKDHDPNAALKILKMLEENRIDWKMWDQHGIDIRPCREALDWGLMPEPPSVLYALGMCLQLAWTVWASRGLGGKGGKSGAVIANPPPARTVDQDTGEYFDRCWALLCEEQEPLARAMIRSCLRMYAHPTDEMRDTVAAELLQFFPLEEEKEEQPKPKPAEQRAQQEAEQKEQEHEQYLDDLETGRGSDVFTSGHVQFHDHTATVRRPSMRIARRHIPVSQGVAFRFAHRYFLDKAVFSQRLLTEAGIMIDGSGSMSWTDEDMQFLVSKLPAVRVGVYSGINYAVNDQGEQILGRICTIARDGRFARFDGLDPECNGGNVIDLEALQTLARWPRPRLWLSDGLVCGGLHVGPALHHPATGCYANEGKLHELCDAVMKRHEILRVPTREVMHKLLNRERVRVYRTSTPHIDDLPPDLRYLATEYPVDPQPILFQL